MQPHSMRTTIPSRNFTAASVRQARVPLRRPNSKLFASTGNASSTLPAVVPPRDRAKQQVFDLLSSGVDTYSNSEEMAQAIDALIASNPASHPGPDSFTLGQGTWEVFHAPHIANMSSVLRTRFQPIRYILNGESIISNVQYSNPLLGSGWLSAAGSIKAKDDSSLELDFRSFWVDVGGDKLRGEVQDESPSLSPVDQVIMRAGRAAFFPQFAVFPVLYLDADISVFQFPPLSSNIAIRRVA